MTMTMTMTRTTIVMTKAMTMLKVVLSEFGLNVWVEGFSVLAVVTLGAVEARVDPPVVSVVVKGMVV
jgi:hypothetical protein